VLEFDLLSLGMNGDNSDSLVFFENGPNKGVQLGFVQIILSHVGKTPEKGVITSGNVKLSNPSPLFLKSRDAISGPNGARPKLSIRAKSLKDSSPDLLRALNESVSKARASDHKTNSTERFILSYDELSLLFKKFQGDMKGTVQYLGPLMKLLRVPSLKKPLYFLYQAIVKLGPNNFAKVSSNLSAFKLVN